MRAVTWVRIPEGWRLIALRALSGIMPVRLPDEWLFNEVLLTRTSAGQARVTAGISRATQLTSL